VDAAPACTLWARPLQSGAIRGSKDEDIAAQRGTTRLMDWPTGISLIVSVIALLVAGESLVVAKRTARRDEGRFAREKQTALIERLEEMRETVRQLDELESKMLRGDRESRAQWSTLRTRFADDVDGVSVELPDCTIFATSERIGVGWAKRSWEELDRMIAAERARQTP
jgi:hypothetical protein